jgi:hypothetical protein
MAAESLAVEPLTVPSFGVTSTEIVSPWSPFPGCERSNVSVSELELEVVFLTTPLTFQTYVSVTGSPSTSALVAVAVSVSFVCGLWVFSETVAVGALFATVTVFDFSVPMRPGASVGVASAVMTSPLLGLIEEGGLPPEQLLVA